MKRYIELRGEVLEYELTYKNIKNINLRVFHDGRIAVSAPQRSAFGAIDSFLRTNEAFIFRARERLRVQAENEPTVLCIPKDRGCIPILGQSRRIFIQQGSPSRAFLDEDQITVYLTDPENQELLRRVLREFLTECSEYLLPRICSECLPKLKQFGVEMPILQYRCMVSRWGSCYPNGNKVCFNKFLICVPPKCIRYVVLHELAHFVCPDHSGRFHALMDDLEPDWRELKTLLNGYGGILRTL